jgi:hypothetical protein
LRTATIIPDTINRSMALSGHRSCGTAHPATGTQF